MDLHAEVCKCAGAWRCFQVVRSGPSDNLVSSMCDRGSNRAALKLWGFQRLAVHQADQPGMLVFALALVGRMCLPLMYTASSSRCRLFASADGGNPCVSELTPLKLLDLRGVSLASVPDSGVSVAVGSACDGQVASCGLFWHRDAMQMFYP